MKRRVEEMALCELNYGDLIRPAYRRLPSRGWGQCTNQTEEYLIVYGPKHGREPSIFDTSPYVLPPGDTTPDDSDCDGFLLPADRRIRRRNGVGKGPLAVKFWNYRRFSVRMVEAGIYRCSWDNGVFEPSQINWAIPNFVYSQILDRLKAR